MKNVFFSDEILSVEKEIIRSLSIPSLILMENAGANSARYIIENFSYELESGCVILAGKGSNAGDGFVAARHLALKNIPVKVLLLFPEKQLKGNALVNYKILKRIIGKTQIKNIVSGKSFDSEIKDCGVIIDAVFGVGFKGEFKGKLRKIISRLDSYTDKKIISLDTPSGLYDYSKDNLKVKADATLAMGVKKFDSVFYNGKEASGRIAVMNIGISEDEFTKRNKRKIFETEEKDIKKILPFRPVNSYKYSNGKVLIIGASLGITGAAYLSSIAALKTGSGAVVTAVPESLYNIMELKLTEGMVIPVRETEEKTLSIKGYDQIMKRMDWADSVLIGPGLSRNTESQELVRKIVRENEKKFIIDADGIAAFKDNLDLVSSRKNKVIFTPHLGEFSRLTGFEIEEIKNNFYNIATDFAKKYNCIVALKNAPTVVTDGDKFILNPTGKENLATVGTGDVLAGITSGLYSLLDEPFEAAVAAVFIHGMCGDILYRKTGASSTIASELIDEIPFVKQKLFAD